MGGHLERILEMLGRASQRLAKRCRRAKGFRRGEADFKRSAEQVKSGGVCGSPSNFPGGAVGLLLGPSERLIDRAGIV
ncbi:MAG: hypothetical protein JWN74_1340 [Acidobacteriaceae bacterium]|nr:hypothetical protein [Acidobacteriaceae bacterium]